MARTCVISAMLLLAISTWSQPAFSLGQTLVCNFPTAELSTCPWNAVGGITGAGTNGGLLVTGSATGMLATCSSGQVLGWHSSTWACPFAQGIHANSVEWELHTATLPPASVAINRTAIVTNGASANDCTTGGGAQVVFCYSNGSTWTALSGNKTASVGSAISGPIAGGGLVAGDSNTALGLSTTCSSGQVPEWNGSAWACASIRSTAGNPADGHGQIQVDQMGASRVVTTRYVTAADNWSQTVATPATAGTQTTVTLTPCPRGVNTTDQYNVVYAPSGTAGSAYMVTLTSGSTTEAVFVTSGTCTPALAASHSSGTIIFSPHNSYPANYTVSSATHGIQEAIYDACGVANQTLSNWYSLPNCHVIIPPGVYQFNGTIFFLASGSKLSGDGAAILGDGRRPVLQIGPQSYTVGGSPSNVSANNVIEGLRFCPPVDFHPQQAYWGNRIVSTQRTGGVVTITTARAHGFQTGDMVNIQFTDNTAYWGDVPYITVTSPTTFTFPRQNSAGNIADIALQNTPGIVAVSYEAILDNGQATHFVNVGQAVGGNHSSLTGFAHFFDFWDDEAAVVKGFNWSGQLMGTRNWTGSYFYTSPASNLPKNSQQNATVLTIRDSSITADDSNCVTSDNSNGVYIYDTVCQAAGPWQFRVSNLGGNYQGMTVHNVYSESSVSANPAPTNWGFVNVSGTTVTWVAGSMNQFTGIAAGSAILINGAFHTVAASPAPTATTLTLTASAATLTNAPYDTNTGISPWPGTGIMGLINGGIKAGIIQIDGNQSVYGAAPAYGTNKTKTFYYWLVAHGGGGTSGCNGNPEVCTPPMYIGSWASSGSDHPVVRWARIAGATSYDLIRTTSSALVQGGTSPFGNIYTTAPYSGNCPGGSATACGEIATNLPQCSDSVGQAFTCSYLDSATAATSPIGSYGATGGAFQVELIPYSVVSAGSVVYTDTEISSIMNYGAQNGPVQVAQTCPIGGGAQPGGTGYTSCLQSGFATNNAIPFQTGMLLADGNNTGGTGSTAWPVVKGRLNFNCSPSSSICSSDSRHIITLFDSNPAKTRATVGYRPAADPGDSFIGRDGSGGVHGLSIGDATAIDTYINNTGDGTNWLTRVNTSGLYVRGTLGFQGGPHTAMTGTGYAGFIGPSATTGTNYFLQLPAGSPSASTPYLSCGNVVSGISPCTWTAGAAAVRQTVARAKDLTNATPDVSQVIQRYKCISGGTCTFGLLMCIVPGVPFTVDTCAAPASLSGTIVGPLVSYVGVSQGVAGNVVFVAQQGQAVVTLSTGNRPIVGDVVCASLIPGISEDDGTACTGNAGNMAGLQIGTIVAVSGSITTANAGTTASQTLSDTSVLVALMYR